MRLRDRVRVTVGGVLTVALATAGVLVGASTAQAAAKVTIANEFGKAQADTTYSTPITVSGTGFQSITGGFGGIYVFFGWVDDPAGGSWAPSKGGSTGTSFRYVPDSEAKDNQGFQRFVTFPGSETAYAANGGELAADGTWSLSMTIPGPTFEAVDRTGATSTVNCLEVTCGVITVGAHGVKNPNNETFTPVTFANIYGEGGAQAPAAGGGGAAVGATGGADVTADGEDVADEALPTTPASVGLDSTTIVVGRVLGFTGQGFLPGEQVVASLAGGLGAVGPLVAGAHGEVAGVIQLPADIRIGTHALTLTGAASAQAPAVEFQVVADAVAAAAAANLAEEQASAASPAQIAVGVAGLLLLGLLVSSFATARRKRRAERTVTAGGGAAGTGAADAGRGGEPARGLKRRSRRGRKGTTSAGEVVANPAASTGDVEASPSSASGADADTAVLPPAPPRHSVAVSAGAGR